MRGVTDSYQVANWYSPNPDLPARGKRAFQEMIEHFGGMPNDINVELEILPIESSQYDAELTHLRTEIMAGGGPDVFHLSGFGGGIQGLPDSTLFPNPEHAMASGFFLPLDEYIENAQFMEFDNLDQKVMDAGKYDGKQYILPMLYRIPMGVLRKEADASSLPADWTQALSCPVDEVRRQYSRAATELPGFREMAFEQIADNANEELLIGQDELFQRTKEALDLYREFPEGIKGRALDDCVWTLDYYWLDYTSEEDVTYTFFTPRNPQGGVTASVETWCAVNKNTKFPEEAFFITDFLLSRDFLSYTKFWDSKNFLSNEGIMFTAVNMGAIPVHSSILSTPKGYFMAKAENPIHSERQMEALKDGRESVTFAYLTGNTDCQLDHMFIELVERLEQGENITDNDIRKATDKTYSTLRMMLAES